MKPAKIAVICVAALAAVGLALVVRSMGSSDAKNEAPAVSAAPVNVAKVLVAVRDLPEGHRLTPADMVWKDWVVADVHPAYITDGSVPLPNAEGVVETAPVAEEEKPEGTVAKVVNVVTTLNTPTAVDEISGSVVREVILSGEPIQMRKLVRAGESGYMAAFLEPGMRAMSIPVAADTAAGGFILPGDRVDVLLTRKVDVKNGEEVTQRTVTSTVLQNLKVLAIDQATAAAAEQSAVLGATATLEVNQRDAETMALARADGTLTIILRSYADAGGPRGLIPGAVRRGESYTGRSSGGTATAAENPRTVRIFRGNTAPEEVVLQ